MKIAENDLDGFGAELVDKCLSTRADRVQAYNGLKHYFLFGAEEGQQAPYGKIYPHIDLLTSYLYSQATVEYEISVGDTQKEILAQATQIAKRLNFYFHNRGVADLFAECLTWSLVYNSMLIKQNWGRKGLRPYAVEPHNFGVLDESITTLDDQEAFTHCYMISRDELERRILGLPNATDLMRRITARPVKSFDTIPDSVNSLIIAGTAALTSGTTRGIVSVPELMNQITYRPMSDQDMVEMKELWVWDDKEDDWRTITLADPGVVIYGRKVIGNLMGCKGKHPFTHICPNRVYDYFWGWSEIVGLIHLQNWMTERLLGIKKMLDKQVSPPKALSGWGGITDEKIAGLDTAGSWISEPTPGAKVELLAPDMPNDLFQEILMIQDMFNDVSGLSDVLQGKGESGVRARGHADILAQLGSARIKKRALSSERSLREVGETMLDLMKYKDKTVMEAEGMKFIAAQFNAEHQVKVDAHSSSPVFVNDAVNLAFSLHKAGAIDGEALLELTKPPGLERLKVKLVEAQARMAEQQKQMLAMGLKPDGTPIRAVK